MTFNRTLQSTLESHRLTTTFIWRPFFPGQPG